MNAKLTAKQTEILRHMWSCRFARSMTLTDFARGTIAALENRGLIAWDHDADTRRVSGPAMYGLTHQGVSLCRTVFGQDGAQ